MVPKWAVIVFLVIGILGFLDATYLTVEHYRGVIPPCTTDGCEQVLTSAYAVVWGIPVALFGALYYFVVSILALLYIDRGHAWALRSASWGTFAGLLASLWFVSVQFFILHAICVYCLVSAGTSTALFVLGMWFLVRIQSASRSSLSGL